MGRFGVTAFATMTGTQSIWIIDSEHWPRAYLMAELIERGFEVSTFEQLSQAAAAVRRGVVPRPAAIILELRDQYVEVKLLVEVTGSNIPVLLLQGVFEEQPAKVRSYGWAAVMRRPFTIGAVADKIQEIVAGSSDS